MGGAPSIDFLNHCKSFAQECEFVFPRICIETGTYRGAGATNLSKMFERVYTIELSERWFVISQKALSCFSNISCYQGDSAEILSQLLPILDEPVYFYLDAHYAGGDTAYGKEEVPLLRELQKIVEARERNYSDIIVIDDLRLIGKRGISGDGDDIYPFMEYDWTDISIESIASMLNIGHSHDWYFYMDRIIVFTNLTNIQIDLFKSRRSEMKLSLRRERS